MRIPSELETNKRVRKYHSDAVVKIKIMLYPLKTQKIFNEYMFSKGTLPIHSFIFQQDQIPGS